MGENSLVTRREFMKSSALGGANLLVPWVVTQPARAPNHGGAPGLGKPTASNVNESAILENDVLRIEVRSGSGDITGLYNKRTRKEYIAA